MAVILETPIPETGRLSLHVHQDVQINVSAAEAQRRVTQFVHRRISSQMHGETPTLVLGEQACWRVPVHLTFPSIGDAGEVGSIDVDVETGEFDMGELIQQKIQRHAEALARRITPATTR
jgi:hypothetical protein